MASRKRRNGTLELRRGIQRLEAKLAHHEHRRDVKQGRARGKASSARRDHTIAVLRTTIRESKRVASR